MELNVVFKCLDKTGQVKCVLEDFEKKNVRDFKLQLQNLLGAPACDQLLSYRGQQLNVDSLLLKTLYLREGDRLLVEFPAKADIKGMDCLLRGLKEFAEKVKHDSSSILAISGDRSESSSVNYDHVASSLENLAFTYFIPWKSATSVAQRHYFVQEGGFQAFVEVMKFSHERYKAAETPRNFRDDKWLVGHLKHLNGEQMILQMHCLSLLWNFSETRDDRWLVLKNGGLQWVTNALLLNPHEYTTEDEEFWEIAGINETAVGCLVQYAEFPSCQAVIAKSKETVNKLVYMLQSRLDPHMFYSKYSSQIAANTMFCCACCLNTPEILVDNEVHLKVIKITKCLLEEEDQDLALRYYCCLFLARVRSSPLVTLDSAVASDIDGLISLFLTLHQPAEVSQWEEKHNYVWVSLLPFVSLAFAGGCCKPTEDFVCATKDTRSELDRACDQNGHEQSTAPTGPGMSCENLDITGGPSTVLPSENSSFDAEVKGDRSHYKAREPTFQPGMGENWKTCKSKEGVSKASRQNRTKEHKCGADHSSNWPGSLQTQRFGVFTLQHMLHIKENSQILKAEGLLSYVLCLSWQLQKTEQVFLEKVLRKLGHLDAPSLKVISKSVLAKMNGLETVYKM